MYGAPVYGNLTDLMYYYVDVYVGDPNNPSKQSLIIDTGSTITWFPCQGYWRKCGKHILPQFELTKSSSAKILKCQNHDCEWSINNEWKFISAYNEGSKYEGFYVNDYFQFTSNNNKAQVPKFTFGWVNKETNLFLTQEANGILGLGPVKRKNFKPIFYSYYEDGFIDKLQFSLLFGKNGGMIYFGGFDESLLVEPPQKILWMENINEENYMVKFDNYAVGETIIPGLPMTAKIDSGVSMVYMTKKQLGMIDQTITNLCKQGDYKCFGKKYSQGCYKFIPTQEYSYLEFFLSYPVISFHVGGQRLKWFPNDYFYKKNPTTFWLAIDPYSSDESKIVLGAGFLRHNLAIFDIENRRIGIGRASSKECTEDSSGFNTWKFDPYIIEKEQQILEYNKVLSTKTQTPKSTKKKNKY